MKLRSMKGTQALLAAVVTALVVMPIAIAGASGGDASASAKSTSAKQLNALKKQSAVLAKQAKALAAQVSKIEAKVAALEGKPAPAIPTTLPPSGAAGGSLTGTFPNPALANSSVAAPEIANGSVFSTEIANDSVDSVDIGTSAVQSDELANGSVQGQDLGEVEAKRGTGVLAAAGVLVQATVSCDGSGRLLGGGFEWANQDADNTISVSSPSFAVPGAETTWVVSGKSAVANTLFAEAICLKP